MSKSFWYLLCSQTHGSCTASATGAVCEVRRPPAGHLVGARQSGFGFHGIARISQLRRNAGIISGKRVVLGGVPCVITARAGRRVRRASPRARAVGELGRKRRIARACRVLGACRPSGRHGSRHGLARVLPGASHVNRVRMQPGNLTAQQTGKLAPNQLHTNLVTQLTVWERMLSACLRDRGVAWQASRGSACPQESVQCVCFCLRFCLLIPGQNHESAR